MNRPIKFIAVIAAASCLCWALSLSTPSRVAAAPPAPCSPPPPAGVGATSYHVFATLPVGAPAAAQAVCITIPGAPSLNSGAITLAPAVCPPGASGAGIAGGVNAVWADWGTPCVSPGATVVLQFMGAPGLPLGHVVGAATWLFATGGIMAGDATVWPASCPSSPPGVGGVPLVATMVAPAGGPYDGVCFFAPAVGGFHSPTILAHPPGCPVNFAGAAVSSVWDDFTTLCANAGDMLTVKFFGPPGLVGTCTSCATWLDGAVMGDVTITAGPLDTDEDGCPDSMEPTLTPPTDPNNPWDFYSVPVPALFSAPNPTTTFPDSAVGASDAQAVFAYFKAAAHTGAIVYEQDLNANGVKDGIEYDRTVIGPGMSGPPDGVVAASDAQLAFAQFKLGYHC